MDLNWDDLRILLALLRTRQLADAALRLGVDRSTVSRRLAALERAVGAPLFLRTREGLRPSAAAERLRPYAERLEADIQALQAAAGAGEGGARGLVRVSTTEAFATFLVQRGLLELRHEHPDIVVELLGGNRPLDLAAGEADLALRFLPPKDAALLVRCVARMGLSLYGSARYLRARGQPRGPDELAGHDLLQPSGELLVLPEATWMAAQPGARVVFQSNSYPTLLAACAAGHGLTVLPRAWGDLEADLVHLFAIDALPPRALWLVTQAEMARRPEVAVVARHLGALAERATRM